MLSLPLTFKMSSSLDHQWERYVESIPQIILSKIPHNTNINIRDVSDSLQRIVYIKHLGTKKCFPRLKRTYSHMMSREFTLCDENWRLDPQPSLPRCREYSMCRSDAHIDIRRSIACLTSDVPRCQMSTTRVRNRVAFTTLRAAAQQECIQVEYGQNGAQKVKVNRHVLNQRSSKINVIKFLFNTHRFYLGLNITFKTFSLSDMCFVSFPYKPKYIGEMGSDFQFRGSCHYVHGTEYVMVDLHLVGWGPAGWGPIYYCLKRPQWSIYTRNTVTMEYSLCGRCANLNSAIIFAYQVIDVGTLLTKSDDFSQIMFGTMVKGSLCLLQRCGIPRQIIYIKGFKYQTIVVTTVGKSTKLWDGIYTKSSEEKYQRAIRVNYFFVILTVSSKLLFVASGRAHDLVKYTGVDGQIHNISVDQSSSSISFSTFNNCSTTLRCRLSLALTNVRAAYIHLNISHMTFTGLQVPGCLFGGISFYEYEVEDQKFYGFLKPTHYNVTKIESLTLCNSDLDSQQYNLSTNHIQPYISSNSTMMLVIYADPLTTMEVKLKWKSTDCKGIFINPCARHFKPLLSAMPEMETLVKGFKYGYSRRNNSCVSYQIGSRYLPHMPYIDSDLVFVTNLIFIKGCISVYPVDTHSTDSCVGFVDFLYVDQAKSYPTDNEKQFYGHHLYIHHDVENKEQMSCKFRGPNEKLKSKELSYNYTQFSTKTSQKSITKFKMKVLLKQGPIVKRVDAISSSSMWQIADEFKAVIQPYSQSFSLLTLRHQLCSGVEPISRIPISRLADNQPQCLRDSIQDKAVFNGVLELNFIGDFVISNCSLGTLKISTLRCLKKHERFREIPKSTYHTLYCMEKDNNENSLTWTLNLTTTIVKYNSKTIMVDLPGSVYDSFISGISRDCCESPECWLQYRWRYDTTTLDMLNPLNPFPSFKFPPLTRKYFDTRLSPSSWFDAQKMCAERGYYLPILDNYNKISSNVKWIKAFGFHFPMHSIFIGIQKLVSLMYFHCLFLCLSTISNETIVDFFQAIFPEIFI